VYNSLCSQTYRDFEWLIIDDGSTDETADIVGTWTKEAEFPIRYYYQENQGKHIAWNKAADLARGEHFLCADSDDAFLPEALERFHQCLKEIDGISGNRFYGVVALCMDSSGALIGQEFPSGLLDTDFLDLYYFRYRVAGEKWHCGKTSVHREIRFDETIRGSLVIESTVWVRIGQQYKIRLLNAPLRVLYSEPDSLCHTFSYQKNAEGMRLWSLLILNDFIDYYASAPEFFSQMATVYTRSCFHLGISTSEQRRILKTDLAKSLWFRAAWRGLILFLYDKIKRRS
jgi:glycosyltransferase involved in cell wall biosynthesis